MHVPASPADLASCLALPRPAQVSPDRVLTISGERKSEHREGSEEEGNLRIERSHGERAPG